MFKRTHFLFDATQFNKPSNFKITDMKNLIYFMGAIFLFLSFSFNVFSQCLNSSAYGSATAPSMGNSTTISTCNYYGEYSTISSVAADQEYTCDINLGGYVTVRSGSSSGSDVAHGPVLLWTAASSGTHYVHWNSNSACGTEVLALQPP